jgi:hypothetical protein
VLDLRPHLKDIGNECRVQHLRHRSGSEETPLPQSDHLIANGRSQIEIMDGGHDRPPLKGAIFYTGINFTPSPGKSTFFSISY